jgi:hypothetical protein
MRANRYHVWRQAGLRQLVTMTTGSFLPPKKSIQDWAFAALVKNAEAEPNSALRWWPSCPDEFARI